MGWFVSSMEKIRIGGVIIAALSCTAGFALVVNCSGWYQHRIHWRGLSSVFGPAAILATLFPLWQYGWSTYLFYAALILMLAMSIADLIWPAKKVCPIPEVGR